MACSRVTSITTPPPPSFYLPAESNLVTLKVDTARSYEASQQTYDARCNVPEG
jgi:hypothetical protein